MLPGRVVFMAALDSTDMSEFAVRRFASTTLVPSTDGLPLELFGPVFGKIGRLWLFSLFEGLVVCANFLPRRLV